MFTGGYRALSDHVYRYTIKAVASADLIFIASCPLLSSQPIANSRSPVIVSILTACA
jgi:hypothetical protein